MHKKLRMMIPLVMAGALLLAGAVLAEDGALFRRNISKTPDLMTEKAAIYMMDFYVPAQRSTGEVAPVDNYCLFDNGTSGDDTLADEGPCPGGAAYEARDYAKPLVAVYIDGTERDVHAAVLGDEIGILGAIILGDFDAYASVSLDDGTSWKRTNLSRSGDLSSFSLATGEAYPGGVPNVVHQVAGDRILVAWISKYCDGGSPLYKAISDTMYDDNKDYLADLETTYGKDAIYLYDFFGVAGNQGSVNYTLQGFPEVGEVPFSCVWTARGKLVAGDDPTTGDQTGGENDIIEATHVLWTKPERLTSGSRDANLPAVDCVKDAGCILTWQEDPLGLRPGQGLGPGEGWSGAIANGKTDIWYSYIAYNDFDLVFPEGYDTANLPEDGAIPIEESGTTTLAKPYVPMAMPIRLTDNNACRDANSDPYCWINFDTINDRVDSETITTFLNELDEPEDSATFCDHTLPWVNPGGTTHNMCVTTDGRVLNGRVASTRVRLNLKGYDSDGDGTTDRAWVIMAAEETKAMGDRLVDPYGNEALNPLDIGKDIWYYSFDMFEHPIVDQGGILNQPAVCSPWTVYKDEDAPTCTPYEFFPVQQHILNEGLGTEYVVGDMYLTEIARRFALTTNSVQATVDSNYGLAAMLIYKQGIINQGGPADIMLRRVLIPEVCADEDGNGEWDIENCFDPAVDNPYAYENIDCDEWAYTDGDNPVYLKGICLSPAINISGTTIVRCDGGTGNDTCADTFPVADDGSIPGEISSFPKVYEWRNCDGASHEDGCEGDSDLDDQVWDNPFDVAKGHRGFLDGDFVMMMYAWAPNWKANSVGNDHYNLYVRRSFDGGQSWTTTPTELGGMGTTFSEYYYGTTIGTPEERVWEFGAGEFEQARNVSLLTGNKVTILDPRYSPTGGLKLYPTIRTDWLTDNGISFEGLPYDDDAVRARDKFFMVYETGDNTTVAEGEAVPLDLFYSRATVYGDVWEEYEYGDFSGNFWVGWPWLEKDRDILSGEASMLANPGGTFMYAVWNQWQEEILPDGHEHILNSDIAFRRLMYEYVADGEQSTLPPFASILYASHTIVIYGADETLTFIGSVRMPSGSTAEIAHFEWRSDIDGLLSTEKSFSMPASRLSHGQHTISFRARDSRSRWSRDATVPLYVGSRIFLPMATR